MPAAHNVHNRGNGAAVRWLREHASYDGDGCLIWPFARLKNGYGTLAYLGDCHYAHRFMCELVNGPPPSPLHETAHSCGKGHEGCAHPKHLSWKTKSGNMLDSKRHGTHIRSRRNRLKPEQVAHIRALKGTMTQAEIAGMFKISEPTVRDIYLGRSHRKTALETQKPADR